MDSESSVSNANLGGNLKYPTVLHVAYTYIVASKYRDRSWDSDTLWSR